MNLQFSNVFKSGRKLRVGVEDPSDNMPVLKILQLAINEGMFAETVERVSFHHA